MGWSKYNEDNNEINETRLFKFQKKEIEKIQMFRCPYCFSYFNSKEKLYEHIKQNYNEPKFYLIINGAIVNYDLPVTSIISASITSRSDSNTFFINNNEVFVEEELDITELLQIELDNHNSIKIRLNNDDYTIYKINYGHIDVKKINLIIEEWNLETSQKNLPINRYKNVLNVTETLFLNGIYNYFAGAICQNSSEKDQRYFDALKFLYGFSDRFSIARHIIQIICFKYNWGDKLLDFADESNLYKTILSFFNGEKIEISAEVTNKELYIEDELEKLIDICSCMIDLEDLSKEEYDNFYYNNDSNVVDKIKVIIYREELLNNNAEECKLISSEIKSLYFKKKFEL
ncbi:MAG: C2H2-type zinc finger protein [bacterium]